MTIHILLDFLSCTSLYKWLSIFFWIFVMHISERMTIHIVLDFRHAHLSTNDYPYSHGFLSCTSQYEWLSILFLNGFSSCTSLYEWLSILFLNGFLSCTFLYECLSIFLWVFIMHNFIWMTAILTHRYVRSILDTKNVKSGPYHSTNQSARNLCPTYTMHSTKLK